MGTEQNVSLGAAAMERKRCADLDSFCERHRAPDGFLKRAITEGWTTDRASEEILRLREAQGDDGPAIIPGDVRNANDASWDHAVRQFGGK
ncbi:MAG: hypothetical protein VX836_18325 [Pseudomonadota bacterium]|nr:hypothetical protein [Pseudomonadota bacterium]